MRIPTKCEDWLQGVGLAQRSIESQNSWGFLWRGKGTAWLGVASPLSEPYPREAARSLTTFCQGARSSVFSGICGSKVT